MKVISFVNEKGNVNATMRKIVREQVQEQLEEVLTQGFDEVSANAVGGYSLPIATDRRSGDTIYVHVDFTISNKEKVKSAKKTDGKTAKKDEIEVPNLFEVEDEEDEVEAEAVEDENGETAEV